MTDKINNKINSLKDRFLTAFFVTVILHACLMLFSTRTNSFQPASSPQYRAYILTPDSMRKENTLSSTVRYKSSSYIFSPDIRYGFSSFAYSAKTRFNLSERELSPINNYIYEQDNSYYLKDSTKRISDRTILSAMAFVPQFSDILSKNLRPAALDYPLAFDSYGKIYKDLSKLLKTLDRKNANTSTELMFEIRNSNTIPSVKVIKGSTDQDLDFAAAKLAIPFVVSEMSKSGINKILLTINWR